jgi:hypothetical protein
MQAESQELEFVHDCFYDEQEFASHRVIRVRRRAMLGKAGFVVYP